MFTMFEEDYIMRMIKNAVRMLLKLLFNIDTAVPIEEVIQQSEERALTEKLLKMAEQGEINEAENELYDYISGGDRRYLKTALIFYYRLAQTDNDFLVSNNYSQQEIKDGIERLIELYDIKDISDMFMEF